MSGTTIVILIILGIILFAIIWAWLKPYTIKYDTTLAITGGLGSGKTLTASKIARTLWKKAHIRWRIKKWFDKKHNQIAKWHNENLHKKWLKKTKEGKKCKGKEWEIRKYQEEPKCYTNFPLLLNKRKNMWALRLTKEMLMLQERINEGSIVLIDELPQLVNQFNWNIQDVQNNVNEFITFYRHYIGYHFIVTAQSIDDIVVQIRRKLNTYYWLYDFHKFLFIFYKVRICSLMTSDLITNVSTTFIEDNTKWKYGCLLPRRYSSRCYKHRYDKVTDKNEMKWKNFYTKNIIRFSKYDSPLDPEQDKGWHKE